jgi:hypothetical protein
VRAAALLIAGALSSCMCGTLSREELAEQYPYAAGTLYSRGGLMPVVRELEQRVGGSPQLTDISISPGWAQFRVRDPKKPGNLDAYRYDDGTWHDPEPVETSRGELEDAKSFGIAEVPALDKLRDLIDQALGELKIEKGRIEGVSISKWAKGIELSIDIKGPRERGRVTFDGAGKLVTKRVD